MSRQSDPQKITYLLHFIIVMFHEGINVSNGTLMAWHNFTYFPVCGTPVWQNRSLGQEVCRRLGLGYVSQIGIFVI